MFQQCSHRVTPIIVNVICKHAHQSCQTTQVARITAAAVISSHQNDQQHRQFHHVPHCHQHSLTKQTIGRCTFKNENNNTRVM